VDFPISKNVYNNLIKLFSIEEKWNLVIYQ
jgi:hypothetical protein